jgi:hypothetical protein
MSLSGHRLIYCASVACFVCPEKVAYTKGMTWLSFGSSWVLPLCPPGRFLGSAFPAVAPRCIAFLVLPTRSAMMRFPFLVCITSPPRPSAVLLLPCLPTVMMNFTFRVFPTVLLWFSVLVMLRCLSYAEAFSHFLLYFPSYIEYRIYCSPSTCLAGGRRCPLGYGQCRFASFCSSSLQCVCRENAPFIT